ncbi:MAG: gliding motility-associated C-terminal domain-containing protein, partial [Flavobacteriales bacterium]|nr:gliding motility-associated C-terminal domain-containing protein [Flavobacteriales bacterium]
GGTAPYTFLWDPGTGNQTDSTAIGLCAGTYLVTVNDFQGCVDSTSVIIVEPLPLIPNFTTLDATCGVCDGEASSAPAGGTAPYTFNWYNAFFASPPGNDTIFLQCAGFRDLEITDDSNCVDTFTVGINNFGAPIIDSVDSAGISCFGECDGVAIVYVQPLSGSPPYTYAWSTSPDTIDTATGLCIGTTIVQVTDFLNCIVTEDIIITGPTPIVSLITGTNISCFGACDGTASVTPFGGEPPYTYLWFPGGQTTSSISGICADTLSCRITDSTGCIIQDTIILTEPAVFNVNLVDSTNISCFGACDGIITVTVTGGTGPYAYLWDDPFGQTNSVANGICGDSITKVVVTDAQGCQDSLTVTLSQPALLVATIIDSNNVTCFGFCNGDATVGLVGGTTPYAFLWNNSPSDDTTALADTLCAGILYKVIVTDTLGCQDSTTVMLSEPAVLTATVTDSTNANCNGVCDGTATVVAAGGSGTYTYSWDNIGPDSITVADSLCAGTMYHITVVDSLNCIALDSVTLSEPTVLGVTISNSTNISCKDACDGTARGTVTGGTAPYTYVWSNGDADTLADSLCAGVPHMLTVTDSLGCMDSVTVTLTEPDSLLINIFDSVNATCFGVCDGIARTVTTGGTLSYTYVWSLTSDTLDSAIALCADTMNIVIVTDSNGCTASDSVMLSQPLEIFATITDSTDANCFGVCDGQAVITGSGGNPPLSFLWQTGETNDTALVLCADSTLYGVVLDSLGCTDTAFFSISQPTDITITFTDSSAALCNGGCEGDATIAVSGGSTPYTLIWDNGDSGVFADTLCAGYTVINVTDSIGCVKSDSINIIEPLLFVVDTVSTTSAACDSSCNAMAVVFGTGGTTPYTFTWSDSLPTVNDTAINLCASTYIVTAVDSNGCAATDTIVLFGPDSLTIVITDQKNATCAGATDGEGTVQAGGGVLPYTYTWIDTSIVPGTIGGPGPNDTTLTGLGAGTYFAVVTDGNGCKATVPVVITEPLPLQANVCFTKNVTCFGVCNGIAAVCPVGGTAPFTYLWDDPLTQTTDSAVGLCADTLGITVTDSNGCIALDSLIIIEEPGLLSCLFTNAGNTGCGVDSAIGFAVTQGLGGSPPYTYLWNTTPPGTSDSVGNLLAGSYTVAVIDTNNCTSFCSITISDTSDMSAAITDSTMVSCYGVCDGGAVVTASGSTQPYSYNWLDVDSVQIGQTNDTASALCAGFYRAIVKSNAACFRSVPITITETDSLVAFISDTLNVLCNADSNGRLVVAPTGGTPPYTYAWFDSTGTQIDSVDTLAGLPAGPYDVVVVDSNGCTDSSSAIVSEPLQLFVGVVSTVQPACSNTCDGLMVADASGGTTPYAYLWLPDSIADDSLPNACVDTFIITVTDTNGCFASDTVNLNPVVTIVANGGPDTQVCEFQQLVLTADTAGSTFQWYLDTVVVGDTLSTNATLTTVPLVSGWHQYILVVGDSICSDTDSVAVYIIPVAVDACCETTLALGECIELTGTVTNGAIYSWSPGITLNDPNIFNPEACPLENTTYTLTATNDSGCVGTDTVTITINPDIPDGFTPQGDGFNDVWELNLLSNYKDAEVQVYNRWGQLVFDSPRGDQYATKFDGTFNGEDLPVGTYYFVIKLNDAANTEAITGPITIMR